MTSDTPASAAKARRDIGWRGFIICLVIFGGMASVGVAEGFRYWLRPPRETATATGIVIEAGYCNSSSGSSGGHSARARFTASNGKTYVTDVNCELSVGQRAVVRYDPANPNHNNDSRIGAYIAWGIVVAIFLPLLTIITCLFISGLKASP